MTAAPNYAVAPGEYLTEWMQEENCSIETVSGFLRLHVHQVRDLIAGSLPVTEQTAIRLQVLTSIPAIAWLRHEAGYRADIARLFTAPPKPERARDQVLAWETEHGLLIVWGTHDADAAVVAVEKYFHTDLGYAPGTDEYAGAIITADDVLRHGTERWAHPDLLDEEGIWPTQLTSDTTRDDYVPYLTVRR